MLIFEGLCGLKFFLTSPRVRCAVAPQNLPIFSTIAKKWKSLHPNVELDTQNLWKLTKSTCGNGHKAICGSWLTPTCGTWNAHQPEEFDTMQHLWNLQSLTHIFNLYVSFQTYPSSIPSLSLLPFQCSTPPQQLPSAKLSPLPPDVGGLSGVITHKSGKATCRKMWLWTP